MQSHLLKYVLGPAVMLAATLATNTLKAETVNVPFSFTVAGQTCPAGLYRVERSLQLGTGRVTLAGMSNSRRFTWNLRPGDPAPSDTRVILSFNQVGQTHALETVQYRNGITSKIRENAQQAESVAPQDMHGQ